MGPHSPRTGTVLPGIPVSSGRHGGLPNSWRRRTERCSSGTGDTATPSVPQDPNSLGGKVLHINADGNSGGGESECFQPGLHARAPQRPKAWPCNPGTGRVYSV